MNSVFIVDDNPKNIQVLGALLTDAGYKVKAARDGEMALEMLKDFLPSIILLDILMPELDGFETIARLKNDPALKNIPVIFLTAKVEKEDVIKGFDLGAVDYVTKPFNEKELLSRVKTHIELKESREVIEEISEERKSLIHILCHDLLNPVAQAISILEYKDDKEFLEQMREPLLKSMNNGRELIDLIRKMNALQEGKYKLELADYNLKSMVTEAVDIIRYKGNEKNISIDIQISPELTIFVEKASFINSVVNNLMTNAIKFSYPDSSIEIKSILHNDEIILQFVDHGIGIPKDLLEKIFDVKQKTSRPGTSGELGTGFGMPMVKNFINSYGARLEVSSRTEAEGKNTGTEINIYFPRKINEI